MTLDEYLRSPGAPSVPELRQKMIALGYDVKSADQIRQWRHNYAKRIPSPEYCMGIHLATGGKVLLSELRPDDWKLIWPEYHGNGKPSAGNGNRKTKEARAVAV